MLKLKGYVLVIYKCFSNISKKKLLLLFIYCFLSSLTLHLGSSGLVSISFGLWKIQLTCMVAADDLLFVSMASSLRLQKLAHL